MGDGGPRGAKALSAAVREVFGDKALIQGVLCISGATSLITSGQRKAWVGRQAGQGVNTPTRHGLVAKRLATHGKRVIPAAASLREGWRRCSPSLGWPHGRLAKTLHVQHQRSMLSIAKATTNVTFRAGKWCCAGQRRIQRER